MSSPNPLSPSSSASLLPSVESQPPIAKSSGTLNAEFTSKEASKIIFNTLIGRMPDRDLTKSSLKRSPPISLSDLQKLEKELSEKEEDEENKTSHDSDKNTRLKIEEENSSSSSSSEETNRSTSFLYDSTQPDTQPDQENTSIADLSPLPELPNVQSPINLPAPPASPNPSETDVPTPRCDFLDDDEDVGDEI